MNLFVNKRFFVQRRILICPFVLPGSNVGEFLVVTQCLAIFGLILFAEMAATRFFALQRVVSEQFSEFKKIDYAARVFERGIEFVSAAEHIDVLPEFGADFGNAFEGMLKTLFRARHPDVIPHQLTEFAMKIRDGALAFDRKQPADASANFLFGLFELSVIG